MSRNKQIKELEEKTSNKKCELEQNQEGTPDEAPKEEVERK